MDSGMSDRDYIIKNPQWDSSQDYERLRKEGLLHIEKLASKLWTDYNTHDPGITLLEILCYAITDLGYRSNHDIKDILTKETNGVSKIRGQFHTALEIFSCEPVTFNDLRKLIIDIDGIRNAWIDKHKSIGFCVDEDLDSLQDCKEHTLTLNGVYDVFIEYGEWIEDETKADIIKGTEHKIGVKDLLHKHRNVCEDFINICDPDSEQIAVCADLEVSPGADLEAVLAEVFYQIDTFISPEVRFYTIEEMLQKGKTSDEIFSGPKLQHGFIDDDELQQVERRCSIAVSDIIRIIMDVPELVSVKGISLLSYIEKCEQTLPGNNPPQPRIKEKWVLELADDKFRTPVLCTLFSRITFYKNGLPYFANNAIVEALLKEKKAGSRSSGSTGQSKDLPIPVGKDRKLDEFYPVQNELPASYRTGMIRVPTSASNKRKAQSHQLKAYMMFFEQLLANYLSQLGNIHELFSWDNGLKQSYFSQLVTDISDIEDLYFDHSNLPSILKSIIETPQKALKRKGQFLDHLMARFCESFTDYSMLMFNQEGESAQQRIIEDKQQFLENYPVTSSQRGLGYDYRFPDKSDNISGYQKRVYQLLGIDGLERKSFSKDALSIEQDGTGWRFVIRIDSKLLFTSISCEERDSIETLLDLALSLGDCSSNYRLDITDTKYELVLSCGDETEPAAIGKTTTLEDLQAVIGLFQMLGNNEGLHLIEHVLLRKRSNDGDTSAPFMPIQLNKTDVCECVEVRDPYSFRFTLILPAWSRRFRDMRFRHFVEETLRLEAPAHTLARICWLNYSQMQDFEAIYQTWLKKLSEQDDKLGLCNEADFSGQYPLNETANAEYEQALDKLIKALHSLTSTYPIARLHDCQHVDTETSPVSLNNTILGTF